MGVNPCDILQHQGKLIEAIQLPVVPPATLGTDGAGMVERVGKNVKKFKGGERVYLMQCVTGTFAEFAIAKEAYTFHLHGNINFSQAAALGIPYQTAYRALFMDGHAKPGQDVLVHGASGAVGIACCQIADAHGIRVVGTAGTEQGVQLVLDNGALVATNHNKEGYERYLKSVTRDQGYHLIIEMAADKNLQKDIDLLRPRGNVVVIGSNQISNGKVLNFDPTFMIQKGISILSLCCLNQPDADEIHAALFAGMRQGWLRPVIGNEYPMSQAADAFREVMEHPNGSHGKVIMSPS